MPSLTLIGGALALVLYLVHWYRCFRRNIKAAQKSGLPYVVTPVFTYHRFWLVTNGLFRVLLRRLLPTSWTSEWIDLVSPEWAWTHSYQMFERMKSDVFVVVSGGGNSVFVADADAVSQIVSRRADFPKMTRFYKALDIYGKNVVSTEGSIWRHHRKITAVPFNEKNNAMVFKESIRQGQAMLSSWPRLASGETATLAKLEADTMRVSLHVISRAGFGVGLQWPHETAAKEGEVPRGHTMTYKDALTLLLHNIILVLLAPRFLLLYSPFELPRRAYEAFDEWGKYMTELAQAKKAEIRSGESYGGMDLMGALVRGSGVKADDEDGAKAGSNKPMLSDDEILGNVFVFILAGHETAANAIHFSLVYLALNWHTLKRLQEDLDKIFGGRPVEAWDYEKDVPKLFGSMCGAILNETLRLVPPVINIPKSTPKDSPQPMTLRGKHIVFPEASFVSLCTVAIHKNPAYWPVYQTNRDDPQAVTKDLASWKPERWLKDFPGTQLPPGAKREDSSQLDEDVGGPEGPDISTALYTPPRGSYIPFSEGARACLGRRFAQVEVLAVLAVIFSEYSVELAVDDYADDAAVERMSFDEKSKVWEKAANKAHHHLVHSMGTVITLQMRNAHVPLRFMRRGKERFVQR